VSKFIWWCSRSGDIIDLILMKTHRQKSAHTPVIAAGGIVVTTGRFPLIAVVQRRKNNGWVLPRGKIKPRESALTVARREVEEEIGHSVVVKEFLGTISYESNGKSKIIHFWLMASIGNDEQKLTGDIKAVKWLPLDAAVAHLTQPVEQVFLAHIGEWSLKKKQVVSRRGRSRAGNGRRALRAKARVGEVPRKKQPFQAKTPTQSSVTPKFIRRIFRRLQNPRHNSNQTGWLS
jgi:8-oxo-dGTP diphosphatase